MASSSSKVVRHTPTGPQVFISFRGSDVRNNFISFLDPALREANIKVFIDKDELLGADLANLLRRIEESDIALVIFSKDYTSSERCLDELAKIKECKDQGRLIVIPIFYRLQPSLVKHLNGVYGDNFRDLKRNHQHQAERTQKWEEALVSIPGSKGMPLSDQSDSTYRDFINSLVDQIQRLLEHMAVRGNPKPEANGQGDSVVPAKQQERKATHQGDSMVHAKQQEIKPIHQGGSMVPFMVYARDLQITHYDNPQKWAWSTIIDHEAPK